jgi:hypothetical protein
LTITFFGILGENVIKWEVTKHIIGDTPLSLSSGIKVKNLVDFQVYNKIQK